MSVCLLVLGASGRAAGGEALAAPMAPPQTTLWDNLRASAFDVLEYGAQMVRSVTGWIFPVESDSKNDDIRGVLSLSDKEFRDFELMIRSAGYVLLGYSLGFGRSAEVELAFDLERTLSDHERDQLRYQVEHQGGGTNAMRRDIILGLLNANRYVESTPANGYRFAGLTMRLSSPPEMRMRFRRTKP